MSTHARSQRTSDTDDRRHPNLNRDHATTDANRGISTLLKLPQRRSHGRARLSDRAPKSKGSNSESSTQPRCGFFNILQDTFFQSTIVRKVPGSSRFGRYVFEAPEKDIPNIVKHLLRNLGIISNLQARRRSRCTTDPSQPRASNKVAHAERMYTQNRGEERTAGEANTHSTTYGDVYRRRAYGEPHNTSPPACQSTIQRPALRTHLCRPSSCSPQVTFHLAKRRRCT